jgi:putative methyltransferase (TIGR04325 family)
MGTLTRLRHLTAAALEKVPPLRTARAAYYERQFRNWPGAFRGVYASFDEAARSAPADSALGYDHPEFATLYEERQSRAFPGDYPVLFWLVRLLRDSRSVFDFGGHVGLAYYAFEKYLNYPSDLRWLVCDVPNLAEAGRKLASERQRSGLTFTTEFADLATCDILLTAGALQYIEEPLAQKLSRLARLPPHILINRTALYDGPGFVTLQNTQYSYNPYGVLNYDQFVRSLEQLGYTLVDRWENLDLTCIVPFNPEHSLDRYRGLYLTLGGGASG